MPKKSSSERKKEPSNESLPKQVGKVDRRGFEKAKVEVFDKDELDKMPDEEIAERAIFAAVENPAMGQEIARRVNQRVRKIPERQNSLKTESKKTTEKPLSKKPPSGGFLLYFNV